MNVALAILLTTLPAPGGVAAETAAAPGRLELPGKRVEIGIDPGGGVPLVDAKLGSGRPLRLILDTGAVGLMINRAVADDEGLEVVGETTFHSPLGGGAGVEAPQVWVELLTVGGARLHGVTADLWDGDSLYGSDGVLGLTMFRDALATLDLPGNRLILTHGALRPGDEDVLPFQLDGGGVPEVFIRAGERSLLAHLDTGNPQGVVLPLSVRDGLAWAAEPRVVGRVRTVDAVKTLYSATLAEPLVVLGRTIQPAPVHLLEGASSANVGYALLRDWELTFDQKHRLLVAHGR
jgi:hypothetical protein